MSKNTKIKYLLLGIPFLFSSKAYAMCPVCTLAVGSAVVLLEKYGVDNIVSGFWIGGLLISSSLMTINWLRKKELSSALIELEIFILFYLSIIIPFHHKLIIGNPTKMIWGMDKTFLGIGIGSVLFYLAGIWYQKIKERNGGHAQFPFQKVVVPISPLVILSIVFYFITKK